MDRLAPPDAAYVIGNRSEDSCGALWAAISGPYRQAHSYSDFWKAYQKVFPKETHRSVGKESGETYHVERRNKTLRRLARYTRKTLAFSKSDDYHRWVTHLFIRHYNLAVSL